MNHSLEEKLIWVTRGRTWGFRFLRDGGESDPLPVYEAAFAGTGDEIELWRADADRGALRFPDPLRRKDQSGRVIPHDFVIFHPTFDAIHSVRDGLALVWPLVSEEFEKVWDNDSGPPPNPSH